MRLAQYLALALALVQVAVPLGAQGSGPSKEQVIEADIMAAASKARPAEPIGMQGDWFPIESYPPEALRANEQGRVGVVVQVDTDGRPTACSVSVSSGSASLDRATCDLAIRNGRFTPARDDKGRAIASSLNLRDVVWMLDSPGYDVGNGPVVVPMPIKLVTELDEEGRITGCYAINLDGSRGQPCPPEMIGNPGGPIATRGGVRVSGRMIQEMKTTLEALDTPAPR